MNAPLDLRGIALGVPDVDMLQRLAIHSRKTLETFVAAAIEALDLVDGDPDIEEDDPVGQADEDGVNTSTPGQASRYYNPGPGCIISDEGL